jgi:hypothetical protein
MSDKICEVRLQNGTMIRHVVTGYEGRIDGITEIRDCFTSGGERLGRLSSKYTFQYRILVAGESARRIAPAEDLQVLEQAALVVCPNCQGSFQSKPGAAGKPRGRCKCGGWICPTCLFCQASVPDSSAGGPSACSEQRKRLLRKRAMEKKTSRKSRSA